jgi:tRNA(His) 5'-end guanylyltransferase
MEDTLGDRMKAFEGVESDRRAVIGQPLCARLDGRSFHTFTQNLGRPYDNRLTDLMVATTKYLVEETQAVLGYTQSDEISLMWYVPEGSESQYLFDGRFQKLASILSAYATGYFVHNLERGQIPEKAGQIPLFDCRVWQVPTLYDAYETFLWREKDAVKNSITMAASAHFSHKALQGVNGATKKDMLREIGQPFEVMPARFRRGSYVQRVKVERLLTETELAFIPEAHRPTSPVTRTEIKVVDLPEIGSRGEDPVKIFFPSVFDKKVRSKD